DVYSATATSVSENADHDRRSSRRGVAGDGGRASAGDATGALDFDHADRVAGPDDSGLDGNVVRSFPNLRNVDRAIHRGGFGGRFLLRRAKIWRRNTSGQRRASARSKSRSGHRASATTIAASALTRAALFQLMMMSKCALPIFTLWILPAMCAFAGVRHFTFLYEAPTSPPGSVELENTVTWAHGPGWNDVFIREELEIGITDRVQLGIYPLDWSHRSNDGLHYDGGAVEAIYNLSNPVIDPVGIS